MVAHIVIAASHTVLSFLDSATAQNAAITPGLLEMGYTPYFFIIT